MAYNLFSNVDPTTWTFSEIKQSSDNSMMKSLYINQPSRERIEFQLCADGDDTIQVPFGVNPPQPNLPDTGKYNMPISLHNSDLVDFVERLDKHIIESAVENSEAWFKKKMTLEEVKTMYSSPFTPKGDYDARLKTKVSRDATKVQKLVENEDADESSVGASLDDIQSRCKILIAVSISRMWFLNRQFGITINAKDILIVETPVHIKRNEDSNFFFASNLKGSYLSDTKSDVSPKRENEGGDIDTSINPKRVKVES